MHCLAVFLISATFLTGCATVTHDSSQSIMIETASADGLPVEGAECRAANDFGNYSGMSGATIKVHRSGDQLELLCMHPDYFDAEGRAISRANVGLAGNVLAGGMIGGLVDQASGAGYSYPSHIRLVFGKSLVFDRANEQDNQADFGSEPGRR